MTDWKLTARRAAEVLLVVALVAAVLPFVVYAAPSLVGGEDSYVVRSGSMEPAIHTGDVVVVADARPAEIDAGDVITFTPDGQGPPTTHRVVSVRENDGVTYFRTKGDANDAPDAEPVVENELVGKVTLVLPYVGYVISFAGTTAGFLTLVAAPFGLLLATEVWGVFRERDDGDDDDSETATDTPPTVAAASDDPAFTLSPTDIRLSIVVLLALAGYSSFVAISRPTPVSIAVAVGAFGTTVYLAAMRYTAAAPPDSGGSPPPAPPHAREVAPPAGDGAHRIEIPEDALGPDRVLPVSLLASPTAAVGDDNGHLDPVPGEAGADDRPDDPAPDATGTEVAGGVEEVEGLEEVEGAEADAAAGAAENDGAGADDGESTASPDGDGVVPVGRPSVSAVTRPVARFLYAVGYVEVTAVRAVRRRLRRLGRRGTDDGGEG